LKLKIYLLLIIAFVFVVNPFYLLAFNDCYEIPPKPLNLDSIDFTYPESLRKAGVEGRVYLQLYIDTLGDVCQVLLVRSVHPELDMLAMEAVKGIKFSPLMHWNKKTAKCNKKVATWHSFPIRFEIGGSKGDLSYFDKINSKEKVLDTLNLPDIINLYISEDEKAIYIDTTISIPEGAVYPEILNIEDFVILKSKKKKDLNWRTAIYVEVFLDKKGIIRKCDLKSSLTPELDSLALKTVKTFEFSPAKNLRKSRSESFFTSSLSNKFPAKFLIRIIFNSKL